MSQAWVRIAHRIHINKKNIKKAACRKVSERIKILAVKAVYDSQTNTHIHILDILCYT
jgi:hypothetical protein